VSLMGHHDGPVQVMLPENQFVYDIKKGKNLGQVKTFETEVRPVRPSIFALFDQELARPEVKLESETVGKGSVGKATIRIPGAMGKHALKVTAKTSMGEEADWMKDILILDEEAKVIDLPIAHNDPEGEWTLSARDLFTGESGTVSFRVE
ncbi:MAG: hypothetical protein KC944_12105, partial [Candidatus Omnitrophica bacterium]|nr:hypothetical protein [Candidatus Omnitrophota bacterium]